FHKGNGYCSTCDAREFKSVPCSSCAGSARMHRRAGSTPLCGTCSRARRTCLRCSKAVPVAGKRIQEEAVACPSCARHLRGAEACARGGRTSSGLLRVGEGDGLARICRPCSTIRPHSTSLYCRRYRRTAGATETGGSFCVDCGPNGEASHDC